MINKKGLWFLTLFSLILVLSVYYITMPDEMFISNNTSNKEEQKDNTTVVNGEIEELTSIDILKQEYEDEILKKIASLEETLNDTSLASDEKNTAYEEIKTINNNKGIEQNIEKKLKNKLDLESFVKKQNNEVEVVVNKKDHNVELANQIMVLVQETLNENVSVSVKFSS